MRARFGRKGGGIGGRIRGEVEGPSSFGFISGGLEGCDKMVKMAVVIEREGICDGGFVFRREGGRVWVIGREVMRCENCQYEVSCFRWTK